MAYSIYTLRVPRAWLHRLLHIPSMTSTEWKPESFYREDRKPNLKGTDAEPWHEGDRRASDQLARGDLELFVHPNKTLVCVDNKRSATT